MKGHKRIATDPGRDISFRYLSEKNWNKEIRTEIKTKNISFKRLIIPFKRYNKSLKRYKIELKLKQEKQNGNYIKKNRKGIETTNVSFKRLLIFPFQHLAE